MSREQVAMPRSSFRRLLQVAISASESESSSSQSPRKRVKRMDTETFNDNDEECIEYVRDFKAKVTNLDSDQRSNKNMAKVS